MRLDLRHEGATDAPAPRGGGHDQIGDPEGETFSVHSRHRRARDDPDHSVAHDRHEHRRPGVGFELVGVMGGIFS